MVQYEFALDGAERLTLDEFTTELAHWRRYGKETLSTSTPACPSS